ncbi:MAG: glycosyltransferase [Caldilineae bacterium]|nr:MAG: glycosyltransferase [Caldilineae bacterium]
MSFRLLIVLPTSPLPVFSGGRQRMYQILRHLSQRHELTVLGFWRNEEAREGLRQLAGELPLDVRPVPFVRLRQQRPIGDALWRQWQAWRRGLPLDVAHWDQPVMHRAVAQALVQKPYDLIQVEWPYLATYALRQRGLPSVLITHDIFSVALERRARVESRRWRRQWLLRQSRAWQRYESMIYPAMDTVAAMSDVDAGVIRRRAPRARIAVLPNGVDTETLQPGTVRERVQRLLFVGAPTHEPNLDAACWLLSEIWPRLHRQHPLLQLTLVNLDHPKVRALQQPGVEITGRLPDLIPVYRSSDLVLAPLRAGSGTRLKILEAFALGVPVVSTTIGYEGLDVKPGVHLFSADTAAAFQSIIISLLDDRATRAQVAANARRLVVERYDWRIIAAQHEDVYRTILDASSRNPANP